MKTLLIAFASLAALGGTAALADPNCTCRAEGVQATLGDTVCLNTASGPRLAQCQMVLNNTSWKFLPGDCPQAARDIENPVLAMSAAPDRPLPLR